jgi:hypothetical protein
MVERESVRHDEKEKIGKTHQRILIEAYCITGLIVLLYIDCTVDCTLRWMR